MQQLLNIPPHLKRFTFLAHPVYYNKWKKPFIREQWWSQMGSPPVLGQTFCMSFTDSKELSLRNETNFYLLHYSFASILRKSGTVTAFVSSLGSPKIPGILSHVAPLPLTFITFITLTLSVLTCITCASAYISQLSKVQSCLLSLAVVRSLWRPDSVARDIS